MYHQQHGVHEIVPESSRIQHGCFGRSIKVLPSASRPVSAFLQTHVAEAPKDLLVFWPEPFCLKIF
jgi:hypothetical protein